MASEITQQFMDALSGVEEREDVEAMAELFADDAELINPARISQPRGKEGARTFWREYRGAFDRIHSDFTSVKEGDGFATLEWHSEGAQRNGEPLRYDGVSLIEFRDGRIHRFATYYDSSAFVGAGKKGTNG
ncbi:MAG: nuclear transport factor 2 family protein [Phycisphaeraceae bacterium]